VLERYGAEIWRVTGVLDAHLKKTGGEWLVGEKCTYADLSFVPWYWLCPVIIGESFEKVSCLLVILGSVVIPQILTCDDPRTGSPSTRPAMLGTRSCRLDLLLPRLGRRGRRLWANDEFVGS
jgi:hypothetical protein